MTILTVRLTLTEIKQKKNWLNVIKGHRYSTTETRLGGYSAYQIQN